MGRFVFKLPDVGEGTAEAELVGWHVKVGDTVAEDQILADIMTDKATVELTSPVAGVVTALHGEPGVMSPVGGPLVEFEIEGAGNAATDENPSVTAQERRDTSPSASADGEETADALSPPHSENGEETRRDSDVTEGLSPPLETMSSNCPTSARARPRPSWSPGTWQSAMRSRKTRCWPRS